MANKSVFASLKGRMLPQADARNAEGVPAHAYAPEHKLAQMAVTGTFGQAYYHDGQAELETVVALAEQVEAPFLARTAVYARENGYMKDMPAVLLAVLARRDPVLFRAVFNRVVTHGKMLRTVVQVMRSGQTGRKSLGSAPKAMVQNWLNTAAVPALLNANVGRDPSLADVLRMVHPKPADKAREALFAWVLGKPADLAALPKEVQDWMAFKETGEGPLPQVPFQMLTQLPLTTDHWAQLARQGSWQMVRQSLNTFLRHGVFDDPAMVALVADKLRDPAAVQKARAFPYQLMVAALNTGREMPGAVRDALHDAMELAVRNVPKVAGEVVVAPDISGSMMSSVTGYRRGATSKVRHVDVAALVAAAFLRVNRSATVLPFHDRVVTTRLDARDTVLTNAEKLTQLGWGGTNISAPLKWLNDRDRAPDLVVFVSDNQSWVDAGPGRGTAMMREWEMLKTANPRARMVCVDIAPYGTTQAAERDDVMNVGGFSDAVFRQVAAFAKGRTGPAHWVGEIGKVEI